MRCGRPLRDEVGHDELIDKSVNTRDRQYRCKTLIVGAGLAGGALGFLLRKAGDDVLLLEILDAKEKDKLCGGLTNDGGVGQFEMIFGATSYDALNPFHPEYVRERCGRREICFETDWHALPRKRLDDYALRRYLETGGRLMDRTAVRSIDEAEGAAVCDDLRTGERFSVRFDRLVGADGAMSATRRLTTRRAPRVTIAVEGETPLYGGDIIMDYLAAAVGYGWYIPQGGKATVGCGVCAGSDVDSVHIVRNGLADFCRSMGIPIPRRLRGAPLPTGDDVLPRIGTRTYFIGDAAGLIHNIPGAGISYALLSARLLARAFLEGDSYEEMMRPHAEAVTQVARDAKKTKFLITFGIMKRGNKI